MGYVVVGLNGELLPSRDTLDSLGLKPGDLARVDIDPVHHTVALSIGSEPLVSRTVAIDGQQTALRLEPLVWDALDDIGRRERLSVDTLCTRLEKQIKDLAISRDAAATEATDMSLVAALRVFTIAYYRRAVMPARERAGEGGSDLFFGTPFATRKAPHEPSPPHRRHGRTIDDLIGIGGRFERAVSAQEMDEAVRRRAAERFLGR